MANKIKLARATKAHIVSIQDTLEPFELVFATDTNELGVKKVDGTMNWVSPGGGSPGGGSPGGGGLTFTSIKNWTGNINVGSGGITVDLPLSENIVDGNKYIIVWTTGSNMEYMSMFISRASGSISLSYTYPSTNVLISYGFHISKNTSYSNRFKTSNYFYYELYSDFQEFNAGATSYTSFNIVDILKVN